MFRKNEIIILTTSLFVLLAIAKGMVTFTLWLFRFFGMPQLWEWYRQLENPAHIRFILVLTIWAVSSITWVLRRRKHR